MTKKIKLPEEDFHMTEEREAIDGEKLGKVLLGETSGYIVKVGLGLYANKLTELAMVEPDEKRRNLLVEMAYETLILGFAIESDIRHYHVITSPNKHGKIREIIKGIEEKRIIKEAKDKSEGENLANQPIGIGEIDSDFIENFSTSSYGKKFDAIRQELKNRFPGSEDVDNEEVTGIVVPVKNRAEAESIAKEISKALGSPRKTDYVN